MYGLKSNYSKQSEKTFEKTPANTFSECAKCKSKKLFRIDGDVICGDCSWDTLSDGPLSYSFDFLNMDLDKIENRFGLDDFAVLDNFKIASA